MATPVPGFDDALSALLDREAARVGESTDAFVSRAVAARLRYHLAEIGDPAANGELLATLADSPPPAVQQSLASPILDPARLADLAATGLLDAPRDASYDRIVRLAAESLTAPTAAISLVDTDRQFLFSTYGVTGELEQTRETPMDRSVCQYVVASGEPLIVDDARLHPVLKDHPVVQERALLSYLGIPLKSADGNSIGTLCVWDAAPRQWTTGHVQVLRDLAALVRERIFNIVAD